ncbi:MAG: hypothetical protein GY856_17685, partial [bacterium]|nr:hypothetical protein [bacterium]
IAVEYGSSSGTVLDNLTAYGGSHDLEGGAGTVYLRGPAAVYGDLVVDNGTVAGEQTVLPALGHGRAQTGSGGAVLVTDRSESIPEYFVGHWVEISDADGTLEGTWRIAAVDGLTVTLAPNLSETPAVDPEDWWQGVYLFDNALTAGTVQLVSSDPLRLGGTWEITGSLVSERIAVQNLILDSDAQLTSELIAAQNVVLGSNAQLTSATGSLEIELTGDLLVEPGAEIDLTGMGYPADGATYPGATPP